MSKTFRGGLNDLEYTPLNVEHVCHKAGEKHEPCLVSLNKLYFSMVEKLAELKEAFYFRPCRDNTQFHYENSVVGLNEKHIRERTGHKSNALQRYERSCEEQVFKVRECLGVPNKMNSSKDNFDAESSVGATMVGTTNPVCDLSEFECDVSDEVLASIDESVFVNEECRVSDGNVNCVLKPVFNNCIDNFSFKK